MCPSEPQPPPPPLDQPKVINTSALRVNLTPDNYHEDDENYKDEYTIQASGDPCKEISRTKMKSIWLNLFVNLGRRIFGKPGELGILGVLLRQERKRERRCPSFCTEHETSNWLCYPNKTIGYAHQPTKAIIMFCIHNYLGGLLLGDADQPTKI